MDSGMIPYDKLSSYNGDVSIIAPPEVLESLAEMGIVKLEPSNFRFYEFWSDSFKGLHFIISMRDKPLPPAIAISVIDAQDKKYQVLIPLPDWPEIIKAVELLKKELKIKNSAR